MVLWIVLSFVCLFMETGWAVVPGDRIKSLPGIRKGRLGSQYSGYIDIGEGKFMHYIFVEALRNPSSLPLVLWLNGGPGCSSMDGYLYEHGPLSFDSDYARGLDPNPWTWALAANMLYLESPAGVGFSYSTKSFTPNDNTTADDNYRFLKEWFKKYPEYAQHDFYITGESYAGIYVPMLSYRCALDSEIRFKGMAVGNGVMDHTIPDTKDSALYYYKIGATSQSQWDAIISDCSSGTQTKECQAAIAAGAASFDGYNIYNVFGTCYSQRPPPGTSMRQFKSGHRSLREIPPCLDAFAAETYLNRHDVQRELHVQQTKWDICSDDIGARYVRNQVTMKPEYDFLMKAGYRILVYNGDTDAACPYTGNEYFIKNILQAQPKGPEWQSWTYTSTAGQQIGGHVTYYQRGLTFTTIIGSGHMVPQYKPQAGYVMFQRWLNDQPF